MHCSRSSNSRQQRNGRKCLGAALLVAAVAFTSQSAWVLAAGKPARMQRVHLQTLAAEGSSSAGESVALVKVTEESKMTTAGVLGGLAGFLLGGFWVGAGLFAASSYVARKEDDDVSKALKGVASGSLELLNFGAAMNDKYTVTDKVGAAITGAINDAKSGDNKETVSTISSFIDSATDAVKSLDKEVGIKDTLGTLATSASDLAFQAVDKAIELNKEYKVTDQIVEKIQESTKKAETK